MAARFWTHPFEVRFNYSIFWFFFDIWRGAIVEQNQHFLPTTCIGKKTKRTVVHITLLSFSWFLQILGQQLFQPTGRAVPLAWASKRIKSSNTEPPSRSPGCNGMMYRKNKNPPLKQGYGVVSDPFENAPFFDSCRLDLWEFPRFWTSGLKPVSSFFTLFAWRGNIIPIFAGICIGLWRQDYCSFFRRFFAPKRMFDKKDTGSFICTRCVASSMFVCARITQLRSIQDVCASSKNVNIPTPPHDWPQPQHGFRKKHKTRGVANGAVG